MGARRSKYIPLVRGRKIKMAKGKVNFINSGTNKSDPVVKWACEAIEEYLRPLTKAGEVIFESGVRDIRDIKKSVDGQNNPYTGIIAEVHFHMVKGYIPTAFLEFDTEPKDIYGYLISSVKKLDSPGGVHLYADVISEYDTFSFVCIEDGFTEYPTVALQ